MANHLMTLISVLMIVNAALGQLPMSSDCSEQEQRRVSKEYEQCMGDVQQRLRTGSRSLRQVCFRLEEQVNRCGNVFKDCLQPQDLRRLKDVQIDAFVKILDAQNLAYLYQQCDVVREYRASNRTLIRATDKCNVSQVEDAANRRNVCVAKERKDMQERLGQNVDDLDPEGKRQRTQRIICDFITKTIDDCYEEMSACHSSSELASLRRETYTLLEKSLELQTTDFKLEECNTIQLAASLNSAPISNSFVSLYLLILGLIMSAFF